MSFNGGFTTQGVPYITGSNGQILTWSDTAGAWVPGDGLSSIITDVNTDGSITGSGSPSDPVRLKDDVNIVGNLTVQGTASITHLDTLYQQSLVVGDKYITILSGANNHLSADGSGFLWGSGSTDATTGVEKSVANIIYVSSSDSLVAYPNFEVFNDLNVGGVISGDGSGLTNLPTSFDRIVYVSEAGSDANDGSFTNPLATISGALAYAKTNYLATETVLIEVGPGAYSQDLTIDRYGTYIKSSVGRYEQRAVTVTGKTLINAVGTVRSSHIVGLEGIFFNYTSTTIPTVDISGSVQTTVYLKDCYLAANGSNALKVQGITSANGKVVLDKSYFLSQKGTADNIRIEGGYVKADTIEVSYPNSVSAGTGSGIYVAGNATLVVDRLLVEMPNAVTGSSIIANAPTYVSNASLSSSLTAPSGAVYVGTNNTALLYNTILQNNFTVRGATLSYTVFSDLVSPVYMPTFVGTTPIGMNARFGVINATAVTASTGFSGTLYGTASYALDAGKLGGIATSSYARKDLSNTFSADQVFDKDVYMLGSDIIFQPEPLTSITGDIILNGGAGGGGNIELDGGGDITLDSGNITLDNGNLQVTNGTISGSGTGISNLSSSNWHGTQAGFAADVRSLLSASGGVNYNSSTGVISVDDFEGIQTTGSITGSGLANNQVRLKDSISAVTVTATTFIGNLQGTADYANNSDKLDGISSVTFARRDVANTFQAAQTFQSSINAGANGITGSFKGSGAQVTNLTGSNWSGGQSEFYGDVISAFEFDNSLATSSVGGGKIKLEAVVAKSGLLSTGNITGSGAPGEAFNLTPSISVTSVTASSGVQARLYGTASYSQDSDKLDGLTSSDFARITSNTFNGNQTINGRISASSGITGSFNGDGSRITNISASNWNNDVAGFYSDVQDALKAGVGVQFSIDTDDRLIIEANISQFDLKTGNGITGSGTTLNPFELDSSINITNDVTASNFLTNGGVFIGDLDGRASTASYADNAAYADTASYADDAGTLNGYADTDFALLNTDVEFTSVTGSFSGDGSGITDLSSSNFSTWTSDVRDAFIAGTNITITPSAGQYIIASTGGGSGGGGGGLSTVYTSGSITGSGDINDQVRLKDDVFVKTLQFDTLASDPVTHVTGQLWYNSTSHELKYATELENIDISLGRQILQRCYNAELTALTKGTIVRISGPAVGDAPSIERADWTNSGLSSNTVGVVADTIEPGEIGYVIIEGILKGLNTNPYTAGQVLYLSSSGQLTTTKPEAPKHLVSVGQVLIKNSTNGYVYVHVSNGYEIDELHDVNTGAKSNGDLLTWDNSTGIWTNSSDLNGDYTINGELSVSSGITSSLGFYSPGDVTSNIRVVYADSAGVTYDPGAARVTISNTFNTNSFNTFKAVTRFDAPITGTVAKFTGTETVFDNNIRVNGTASIAYLNTINQNSLQVGDKYITIMSGASDHTTLSGSGILWGSGSTGPSVDEHGANAHIIFDDASDSLEIFPAITTPGNISGSTFYGNGSGITGLTTSSIGNWSGNVRAVIAGSNGISFASNGTASLSGIGQLTALTASSHVSASAYYGNGSNLNNITAEQAKNTTIILSNPDISAGLAVGKIVSIANDGINTTLSNSTYTTNSGSNAIGVINAITNNSTNYGIVVAGQTFVSGAASYPIGTTVYVGTAGSCTNYDGIPSGGQITQVGYVSWPVGSGNVVLQLRVFGQKG